MSVTIHGIHEILRQYHGAKHFPRDQRLRLETQRWRVLDFEGNPLGKKEVERQRERFLRAPQLVRGRKYHFSVDLIVDSSGSVDVSLPVLAQASALAEVLRLGGSYKLVNQLWSHFNLIAGQVNVDVTWSGDVVLVDVFLLPYHA